MFEILFRGKVSGKKKWVQGDYVRTGNVENIATRGEYEMIPIVPGTATPYINLKDDKRKKIFVGDIVKIFWFEDGKKFEELVEVTFDPEQLAIILRHIGKEYFKNEAYIACLTSRHFQKEVIGNRFDNPELLTKKGETVFVYGGA